MEAMALLAAIEKDEDGGGDTVVSSVSVFIICDASAQFILFFFQLGYGLVTVLSMRFHFVSAFS